MLYLPRVGSDHTPLVLDTRTRKVSSPKMFRFEKWWLSQPDFKHLIIDTWNIASHATSSIENWQFKTRLLRTKITGWNKKKPLLMEFDLFDVFSGKKTLSDVDSDRMREIRSDLDEIWKIEEIVVWQRSRDKIILEGDGNNAYIHSLANHRHRRNHMSTLVVGGMVM